MAGSTPVARAYRPARAPGPSPAGARERRAQTGHLEHVVVDATDLSPDQSAAAGWWTRAIEADDRGTSSGTAGSQAPPVERRRASPDPPRPGERGAGDA